MIYNDLKSYQQGGFSLLIEGVHIFSPSKKREVKNYVYDVGFIFHVLCDYHFDHRTRIYFLQ